MSVREFVTLERVYLVYEYTIHYTEGMNKKEHYASIWIVCITIEKEQNL